MANPHRSLERADDISDKNQPNFAKGPNPRNVKQIAPNKVWQI
jgi:hypothetical protein